MAAAALALIVAVSIAGYALGQGGAPSEAEAAAARTEASRGAVRAASRRARSEAHTHADPTARRRGKRDGRRDGLRQGRRQAEREIQDQRRREERTVLDCGNEGQFIFNISVRATDCDTGHSVAREVTGPGSSCFQGVDDTTCTISSGMTCTLTNTGYESSQIRCTDGHRAVRFDTGV